MTPTLEKHLREMGVLPSTPLEEIEVVADPRLEYFKRGYFNDPRDPITGEVPF